MQQEKHPSGLTMERWKNPFKTPKERELVIKWNKKQNKAEKAEWFDQLEEAPF